MVAGKSRGGAVHLVGKAGDVPRPIHQLLGVLLEEDLAAVEDDDLLHHVGGLLYNVGGEDEGAPRLGVLLEQKLVKLLPRHHVETRHRLIQEGELGLAGHGHQDGHHGEHALAELAQLLFLLQAEELQKPCGHLLVPVGKVRLRRAEVGF